MRSYNARSLHLPHPDSASDLISYIYGELRNTKRGCAAFFLKNLPVLTLALLAESLLNTIRQTKEREAVSNYR